MKKTNLRLEIIQKALLTLYRSIGRSTTYNKQKNPVEFEEWRDSLLKRFGYCTELFRKLLTAYLEEKLLISPVSSSPRGVVKQALGAEAISDKEYSALLKLFSDHNQAAHACGEELAEEISAAIPEHYRVIKVIIDRLKKELESQT